MNLGSSFASVCFVFLCMAAGCDAEPTCEDDPNAKCGFDQSGVSMSEQEFIERCEAIDARERCSEDVWWTTDGKPPDSWVNGSVWCTWLEWVPVEVASCTFGTPTGRCTYRYEGDGGICPSAPPELQVCKQGLGTPVRRDTAAGVEMSQIQSCTGIGQGAALCDFDDPILDNDPTDPNVWNYPECACICNPDFPSQP